MMSAKKMNPSKEQSLTLFLHFSFNKIARFARYIMHRKVNSPDWIKTSFL